MQILVFCDIHQDWEALRKIVEQRPDIFICLGDLSRFGTGLEEGGRILVSLKEKLWLMPGNHEIWRQTKALCEKHGFLDFHQKIIKKDGFVFAGLGLSTPGPFNTPGEVSEGEFEKALEKFKGYQNLLLFCHHPPKKCVLDKVLSGAHAGSQAIRNFIEKERPIYFFSGHIHENEGEIERTGETTCFGVGKRGLKIWL